MWSAGGLLTARTCTALCLSWGTASLSSCTQEKCGGRGEPAGAETEILREGGGELQGGSWGRPRVLLRPASDVLSTVLSVPSGGRGS